jgi:tetratricopeptide (TPR) repeat protein
MPHGLAEDVARGDHYAAAGKYDDAVRAYTAVLQVAGAPVVQVLRKLAGVYYHLGQYAQAIEVATAVLVLAPDEAQAYFYRGAAQDKLGHWAQAIQDWQRAARLGDPEARAALGAWGLAW